MASTCDNDFDDSIQYVSYDSLLVPQTSGPLVPLFVDSPRPHWWSHWDPNQDQKVQNLMGESRRIVFPTASNFDI